jgi:hypothetical protein
MRQGECSERKDKIIAPLAFAMKHAPTGGYGHLQRRIEDLLDFWKSKGELYRKFARFMVDCMGNLDILSRVDLENVIEQDMELKRPSWVPPFDTIGTSSLINDLLFTDFAAAKHLGQRQSSNEGKTDYLINLKIPVLTSCRFTV